MRKRPSTRLAIPTRARTAIRSNQAATGLSPWPGTLGLRCDGFASVFGARQGETLSRQARIPGDEATARYIHGERRRGTEKERRGRSPGSPLAADKQRALLIEGPTVLTAPLWAPEGGTVRCKLVIDQEGKISELETGSATL